MSRNDGHQYDQEARVQEQGVAPLLAGPKTSFLCEGRAHHRIHHRLRVSEEGLVDLNIHINKKCFRKAITVYNLPAGTGGGEAGVSTGTGGAGTVRDSRGGGRGLSVERRGREGGAPS